MLTATTESAIRSLVYLATRKTTDPATPKEIADAIGASPTYTAKINGMLARAGILRSLRGVQGGVTLGRAAADITLLDIIQACQGLLIADYCSALGNATSPLVCAFHQAMYDVHTATVTTLTRWTLADLAAKPAPTGRLAGNTQCKMLPHGTCATCAPLPLPVSNRTKITKSPKGKATTRA